MLWFMFVLVLVFRVRLGRAIIVDQLAEHGRHAHRGHTHGHGAEHLGVAPLRVATGLPAEGVEPQVPGVQVDVPRLVPRAAPL